MSSYDEIRLVGIGGYGYHGVLADERKEGQPFHADLVLYLDTDEAARSDALDHTADYSAVARAVVGVIEGEPANLIETVAARIADAVLALGVAKVDVTLHKPRAPLGVPFTDVQVHISRALPTGAATGPAGPGVQRLTEVDSSSEGSADPEAGAESETGAEAEAIEAPIPVPPVPPVPPIPVPPVPPIPAPVPAVGLLSDNEGVPAGESDGHDEQLDAVPDGPVDVVLGLGGNLGDVRQTLREAIADLSRVEGIVVTGVSPLARTAPVTHADAVAQEDYLNAVVLARTTLSPRGLLDAVHRVEDSHGRVRVERWGDRTLDIDIITYGDMISATPDLTLPHPRAAQRAFVLVPWAHLDGQAQLPGEDGGRVAELAESAPDRDGVRWLALDWLEEGHEPTTPAPMMPTADAPAEPAPLDPPPAPPAPAGPEEPPAVSEWLATPVQDQPEYEDRAPALPVPPPPAPASTDREDPAPPAPAEERGRDGSAAGVEWLEADTEAPPLSASPQWLKVNRDE